MKRGLDSLSMEELSDGWRRFEYLDQETEKFTQLLEKYKLQVKRGSTNVWTATLLPYDCNFFTSKKGASDIVNSFLFKLLPRKIKAKALASIVINEALRDSAEETSFYKGLEDGSIDGYCCALTGSYVQSCLEQLLENVGNNERFTYYDSFRGFSGSIVTGYALSHEIDTMGQYLMNGELNGFKTEDQISLNAVHPTLPEFSVKDSSFRESYHKLISNMKKELDIEQLSLAAR